MNANEEAQNILINAYYFCGNKVFATELGLYICNMITEQKLESDDMVYWTLVKDEIYKSRFK